MRLNVVFFPLNVLFVKNHRVSPWILLGLLIIVECLQGTKSLGDMLFWHTIESCRGQFYWYTHRMGVTWYYVHKLRRNRLHLYQTRSSWSVDQGSIGKSSVVYYFFPTVVKLCDIWFGNSGAWALRVKMHNNPRGVYNLLNRLKWVFNWFHAH